MKACAYTFDPDQWEATHDRKSPIEQTWSCPHDAMTDSELCHFHSPPEECDSAEVRTQFLKQIDSPGSDPVRFIGATIGHLDLSFQALRSSDNHPIDLRHATIQQWNSRHAIVAQPLLLSGADIGTFKASNAVFGSKLLLNRAEVDEVEATEVTFSGKVYFDRTTVDTAEFVDADASDTISFEHVSFNSIDLQNVEFEDVSFEGATLGPAFFNHAHADKGNFGFAEFVDVVSFQDCQFDRVDFEEAEFHADATLRNASFTGLADFNAVSFGDVDFHGAEFGGEAVFSDVNFETVDFTRADFDHNAHFEESTADVLSINNAKFNRTVDFTDVDIGELSAANTTFDETFHFEDAELTGKVDFKSVRFNGRTSFARTNFFEGAIFNQVLFRRSVSFTSLTTAGDTSFADVTFRGPVLFDDSVLTAVVFRDVQFETNASFVDTTVTGTFRFDSVNVARGVFKRTCGLVAFSDSTIAAGQIEVPTDEFVFYDVANTTIGDVHLSLAEEGNYGLFEYFYIKNTTLEGFDFGPYKKELSKSGWLLHTSHLQRSNRRSESNVRDRIAAEYSIPSEVLDKYKSLDQFENLDGNPFEQLTPADMENTYLKAKNGAAASGDNKAAAEFFRHEMKSRQRVHKHRLLTTDSWTDRLSSGFNYCANLLIDKTTGYGERPRNVVLTSVSTIGGFAVLYWFMDALPNGRLSEYLLFSLQNFVTFIIGTQPQEAVSIRYLTAIQAFLGAFLIALFVFTLTRSVNR